MLQQDSVQQLQQHSLPPDSLAPDSAWQDVQLPQYYQQGFFSGNSLFHPELPGGRYGTAGDPIPYNARNDNVINTLLLLFFILAAISFASVRGFITRQTRGFFYMPHGGTTEVTETASEVRFQVFLVFLDALLLALLYYFYTLRAIGDIFVLDSNYLLIVINLASVSGYFLLKGTCYAIVNKVFFDGKRSQQWLKSLLFITAVEGALLFPAIVLQAYFDWDVRNVGTYFTIVLIFVKLLTIYKCYVIFFLRNGFYLQIILYFCALELMPMLALWGVLGFTANSLKINF